MADSCQKEMVPCTSGLFHCISLASDHDGLLRDISRPHPAPEESREASRSGQVSGCVQALHKAGGIQPDTAGAGGLPDRKSVFQWNLQILQIFCGMGWS